MKKYIVLPTWLLTNLFKPLLPESHPWKYEKFTLDDWYTHSTYLNKVFSIIFWINGFTLLILLYKIYQYLK